MHFPSELKPLLAAVIVLALAHAVIRVRSRRAASAPSRQAARRRVATGRSEAPIDPAASEDPADALARLRRRSSDGGTHHG